MAPISVGELHLFHRIDREVFFCLVIRLARDPAQSLLVMALWLWLENIGYRNFISKLIGCSDSLINAIAVEAVTCLRCLELDDDIRITFTIRGGSGLPLTTTLMHKYISLHFFRQKRFTAITGIKSVLNKICARIFTDILQNLLAITGTSTSQPSPYRPMVIPGFPHPLFGTFTIPSINFKELDLFDLRIWINKPPSDDVRDEDKTMFLTFSRGFPVTEEEVRHIFTSTYGNCIKVINMGTENMNDQVLFATMVLHNVEIIDQILNGKHIAKLRINGKHIWARKYEHRD